MVGRGLTIRPSYPAADVTLPPAGGGVRRGSDGGEVLGMRSLPGEVVLPRRVTTRAFGCATHVYPPLTPHVSFATPRSKNPLHAYLWRQTRGARTFDCSAECTCGTCSKLLLYVDRSGGSRTLDRRQYRVLRHGASPLVLAVAQPRGGAFLAALSLLALCS